LAVVVVAGAFGIGVGDASATSCVSPTLRFEGGSYDIADEEAGAALGEPAGMAEYPTETGGEESCETKYEPAPVHTIEGVPPTVAVAEEGGAVWVSGGRCARPRDKSVVECLQEPLRFRGRAYHPVVVGKRREITRKLGPAELDDRRVTLGAYDGILPRRMVGIAREKRVVYVADGFCRVARDDGLTACLREPRVVVLGPLPESGRDWTVILYGVIGAAIVLAIGFVARRAW
jgi:hypothetical protein